jgi:tRNA/rRNA methyltransferase
MQIILVEPNDPINIGSVARIIDNFGFSDLCIVTKTFDQLDISKAKISACWADKIVDSIKVFVNLYDAIKDKKIVAGFSSRTGKNLPVNQTLLEFVEQNSLVQLSDIALVFGPEDTGLKNEHLEYVTDLVTIPTNSSNPSINLSHAVGIVIYEFCRLNQTNFDRPDYANFEQVNKLVEMVMENSKTSGFINKNSPEVINSVIGNIFRRNKLSNREVQILSGIFSSSTKKFKSD